MITARQPIYQTIDAQAAIGLHVPSLVRLNATRTLLAYNVSSGSHVGPTIYVVRRVIDTTTDTVGPAEIAQTTLSGDVRVQNGGFLRRLNGDLWHVLPGYPNGDSRLAFLRYRVSTDNGATWSALTPFAGGFTGGSSLGGGLEPAPDVLLVPFQTTPDIVDFTQWIARSTNGGASWSAVQISGPGQTWLTEGSLHREAGGTILCVMRNMLGGALYVATSTDNGATWSTPAAANIPNPNSRTLAGPGPAGTDGIIAGNDATSRSNLCVWEYTRSGSTFSWRARRYYATSPGNVQYPCALVEDDGRTRVVWSWEGTDSSAIRMMVF